MGYLAGGPCVRARPGRFFEDAGRFNLCRLTGFYNPVSVACTEGARRIRAEDLLTRRGFAPQFLAQ